MALGFYFDIDSCVGCRTCQVACKDRNNLDVGYNFRRVHTFETGVYPEARVYHFAGACNHCTEAKCVNGCPTKAMHYGDDGTVQHDDTKCIGCRYCTWNCPYGAPHYNEDKGVVGKCDSCAALRAGGEEPVCVAACVMRAIRFGDLDQLRAEYGPDLVREIPVMPSADLTNPNLLIDPKPCALVKGFREMVV